MTSILPLMTSRTDFTQVYIQNSLFRIRDSQGPQGQRRLRKHPKQNAFRSRLRTTVLQIRPQEVFGASSASMTSPTPTHRSCSQIQDRQRSAPRSTLFRRFHRHRRRGAPPASLGRPQSYGESRARNGASFFTTSFTLGYIKPNCATTGYQLRPQSPASNSWIPRGTRACR